MHWVLVNNNGTIDMLLYPTYNQIGLSPNTLKLANTPLYGFSGCSVQPIKGVEFSLTVGNHPA